MSFFQKATPEPTITSQSYVHLTGAGFFFILSILHGLIVTGWEAYARCRARRRLFRNASFGVKLVGVGTVVLSYIPVLPLVILFLCGPELCAPNMSITIANIQGLQQRFIVLGILIFLLSYALDFRLGLAESSARVGLTTDLTVVVPPAGDQPLELSTTPTGEA